MNTLDAAAEIFAQAVSEAKATGTKVTKRSAKKVLAQFLAEAYQPTYYSPLARLALK